MHHLWPLWDLNNGLLLTVFLEVFSVLFSEIHAFVVLHWAQDFVNNFVGSLFWSLGFFWYFCFPQALLFWPLGLKNLGLNLALYLLSSNALMSGTKGLNYRKRGKQFCPHLLGPQVLWMWSKRSFFFRILDDFIFLLPHCHWQRILFLLLKSIPEDFWNSFCPHGSPLMGSGCLEFRPV